MGHFNQADLKKIDALAKDYSLSRETIIHLLDALLATNGTMAQFDADELGGQGQWMKDGSTMIGDMFNESLKVKVDKLASHLSKMIANDEFSSSPTNHSQTHTNHHAWWPSELGTPTATGSQNDMRYAYFAKPKRLVVDNNGKLTIYDTLDHEIYAFSAKQGFSETSNIAFKSNLGIVHLSDLKKVSK